MSAGAIAMAIFGMLLFYGGLAYCIYRAIKHHR
ncbi:MAG TPA: MetS family NSS transporter small subunit [Thermoplasmatales archaeon]|nr:MetS family NSS transporter small subunit [Thermoplasmatales archaeon]